MVPAIAPSTNSDLIVTLAPSRSLTINRPAPQFIPGACSRKREGLQPKKPATRGPCGGEAEVLKQDRVLASIGFIESRFMGELVPAKDADLMRRSRHSTEREHRVWRLFPDNALSDD